MHMHKILHIAEEMIRQWNTLHGIYYIQVQLGIAF